MLMHLIFKFLNFTLKLIVMIEIIEKLKLLLSNRFGPQLHLNLTIYFIWFLKKIDANIKL